MRVIFLDVDGVLNADRSRRGGKPTGGILGVEWSMVSCLAQIIRQTGAFVVLTSTWKREWGTSWQPGTLRYLIDKLRQHNIEIMGITTEDTPKERGLGIRRWLEYHQPVEAWAVLDDDIFPDYAEQGIMPHLVKTSFYRGGLTKEKIEPCVNLLNTGSHADIGCGTCPMRGTACTGTECPEYKRINPEEKTEAKEEATEI